MKGARDIDEATTGPKVGRSISPHLLPAKYRNQKYLQGLPKPNLYRMTVTPKKIPL
jgi:hypothetical protein